MYDPTKNYNLTNNYAYLKVLAKQYECKQAHQLRLQREALKQLANTGDMLDYAHKIMQIFCK